MKNLSQKIHDLAPVIAEILKVSGAAGASLGIIHKDETHFAGYGYRDIANGAIPDENTLYHLASLSKSFTAAAVGILVDEKRVTWDQPISQILPNFKHPDKVIRTRSTILDCLSHRTGLATKNALWQQDGHELLLNQMDVMSIVSYLEPVEPLGSKWIYNNWMYDIGSEIIEAVSGKSYGAYISEKILDPLDLKSTYSSLEIPEENRAHGYMPTPEGHFTDVGRPIISNGSVMQGADAIKSNVKDLLRYYRAVLESWKQEKKLKGLSASDSPLKNVEDLLTEHIPLEPDSDFGQWYGMGWAIADLPAPLGSIGTNGMFVPRMPIVARGAKKTRVWYHNGSLVGFFSSVHIIPETDSIIVVLVNSIPKNDCADWLGQFILESLLDSPEKNDYVSLARESARSYDQMWIDLEDHFKKLNPPAQNPRPFKDYIGRYYNHPGNWYIEVVEVNNSLTFAFQGRYSQSHRLHPHGTDSFSWPLTEAESRKIGRWPDLDVTTYIFTFAADESGDIRSLCWIHDPDVPKGETFVKETDSKIHDEL